MHFSPRRQFLKVVRLFLITLEYFIMQTMLSSCVGFGKYHGTTQSKAGGSWFLQDLALPWAPRKIGILCPSTSGHCWFRGTRAAASGPSSYSQLVLHISSKDVEPLPGGVRNNHLPWTPLSFTHLSLTRSYCHRLWSWERLKSHCMSGQLWVVGGRWIPCYDIHFSESGVPM